MSESEKNELDASKRATIDDYVKNLEDETFFLKNGREQAEVMGVDPATISRWKKEVDWKGRVEEYRRRYWYFSPHVDMAVIKKALKGDLKAAELYYQRFEGWVQKGGVSVEVNRHYDGKTNAELMKSMLEGLSTERKMELMGMEVKDVTEPAESTQTKEDGPGEAK